MSNVSLIARQLRIVWAAVCAGAALAMVVVGGLAVQAPAHRLAEHAEAAFYVVALLGVAGTVGAFALVQRMEGRLFEASTDAHAEAVLRTYGIAALAAAEVPALAGAVAAFLTGDLLTLAFGVPLFAFAVLLWPSDERVAAWLSLHRRS